jgi:hypothetical protein
MNTKRFLHQRVKPFGWLIQNEQQRIGLKRLDEPELPLHAGTVLAQPATQVSVGQLKSLLKFASALMIGNLAIKSRKQIQNIKTRQIGIDSHLSRQIPDLRPCHQPFGLTIVSENGGAATIGPQQVKKYAYRCRLAGAVQSKEPKNLALRSFKAQIIDGCKTAEPFRNPAYGNCLHWKLV